MNSRDKNDDERVNETNVDASVETKIFFNLNANLLINEFEENVKSLSVSSIGGKDFPFFCGSHATLILLSRKYGRSFIRKLSSTPAN